MRLPIIGLSNCIEQYDDIDNILYNAKNKYNECNAFKILICSHFPQNLNILPIWCERLKNTAVSVFILNNSG